jgi:arylsulfatase A-like enzyme
MKRSRRERKLDGLFIALALSLAFLALSFLRTIGDAGSASFGRGVIQAVLNQPIVGTQLGAELAKFGLVLVLIHSLAAVASWGLARVTRIAWPGIASSQRALTVLWLLLGMFWVLAANAYWYPRTALGEPYAGLAAASVAGQSLFVIATIVLASMVAATLAKVCVDHLFAIARSRLAWTGGAALIAAGAALPVIDGFGAADPGASADKPHVIVIGIDSLRTDFVQGKDHQWTPAVDRFLSESTQFSNALTPLARTFPAWVSIVTGQHPHTTGAFVNLLPQDQIRIGSTLPAILSAAGYETVYAIDEVRFSNLDTSYGFDRMLAPPMGAADFMLGFFADTPFANVLVNTRVGKYLFPYAYGNRAMEKTYEPDTFIDWIDDDVSFDRPTFLAAHLTLAHWPYTWASSLGPTDPDSAAITKEQNNRGLYEVAVDRVDRQFNDLMTLLEQKGALENAIVIVLSDHGESLGESSPLTEVADPVDLPLTTFRLYGHGTHVFSRDQYDIVLAFRSYGSPLLKSGRTETIDTAVTLEDLAPTIADMLGIPVEQAFDGYSLVPLLNGDGQLAAESDARIRFLETEFNPPGISTDGMTSVSAMLTAAETYQIDPETDRVLIRVENVGDILAKRQYAAEFDGKVLASVPAEHANEQFLLYFDPEAARVDWLAGEPAQGDDEDMVRLWQALGQRFATVRERPVMAPPVVVEEPLHAHAHAQAQALKR